MAIEVKVVSESKAAQADLSKLKASVASIDAQAASVTKTFKEMAASISASVVSIAAVASIIKFNDEMKSLSSRLKVSTRDAIEFNQALRATRSIAVETGAALEDVTQLYAKVSTAAEDLNATQGEIKNVVSNVTKAIAIGNASVNETSAAVTQLAQALGSGKLQGDELRSILENSQPLARMIADGLGVSISQMRKLGTEGQLTSEIVFGAILSQTQEINDKFGMVERTIGKTFGKLGTSFKVLFSSIQMGVSVFTDGQSEGGILATVEEIAKGITRFANQLDLKLVVVRYNVYRFIRDIEVSLKRFSDGFSEYFGITIVGLIDGFKVFYQKVSSIVDSVRGLISGMFNAIDFSAISKLVAGVGTWLGKLDEGPLGSVIKFAKKVVGYFAWILDEVITHSSVPDLVKGTDKWMAKLNDGPLASVMSFARKVEEAFRNLTDKVMSLPFVVLITDKIKSVIDLIDGMKVSHDIKQLLGMKDKQPGTYPNRTSSVGYSQYDNNAFVGRGPKRDKENRPFMHDLVNFFSSGNQIPFITTIANTFGAGILTAVGTGSVVKGIAAMFGVGIASGVSSAFSSFGPIAIMLGGSIAAAVTGGPVTKALALILTGAMATGIAQTVETKEIRKTADDTLGKLWSGLNKGIEMLFGSGIFGDKGFGMFLLTAAKIALLFKTGREMIGGGVASLAKAPTTLINNATTTSDLFIVGKQLKKGAEALSKVSPEAVQKQRDAFKSEYMNAIRGLQYSRKDGQALGVDGATKVVADLWKKPFSESASTLKGMSAEAKAFAMSARTAAINLDGMNAKSKEAVAIHKQLKSSQEELLGIQRTLEGRKQDIKDSMRQGITNFTVGAGGALGGAGGFMLGAEIVKGMEGAPEWQKVGVQIMTAMAGQTLGAGVGAVIISGMRLSLALLSRPLTAAIVAAIAVTGLFLTDNLSGFVTSLKGIFNTVVDSLAFLVDRLTGWSLEDSQGRANIRSRARAIDAEADGINADKLSGKISPTEANMALTKLAEEQHLILKSLDGFTGALWKAPHAVKDMFNPQELRDKEQVRRTSIRGLTGIQPIVDIPKFLMEGAASLISGNAHGMAGLGDRFRFGNITPMVSGDPNYGNEGRSVSDPVTNVTLRDLINAIRGLEGGKDSSISHKGAYGKMQIIEETFDGVVKQLGMTGKSFSVEADRVAVAEAHIADLFSKYKDPEKVFKVYNGGPEALKGNRKTFDKLGRVIDTTDDYAARGMAKLRGKAGNMDANAFVSEATKGFNKTVKSELRTTIESYLPEKAIASAEPLLKMLDSAFGTTVKDTEAAFTGLKGTIDDSIPSLGQIDKMIKEIGATAENGPPLSSRQRMQFDAVPFTTLNEALSNSGFKPLDPEKVTEDAVDIEESLLDALDALNEYRKELTEIAAMGALDTTALRRQRRAVAGYRKTAEIIGKETDAVSTRDKAADTVGPSATAEAEGADYVKGLKASVSKGMIDSFRDPDFKASTFFQGLATNFSNAVLDGIARGLVNNLMDSSGMSKKIAELIKGTSFMGEKSGTELGTWFSKEAPKAADAQEDEGATQSWLSSTWDTLKEGFGESIAFISGSFKDGMLAVFADQGLFSKLSKSLGDAFDALKDMDFSWITTAFNAVKGFAGYAEGGAIRGPGTGTSDSIPAMLSNGEFVINAKAAAKFKPLLEKINGGKTNLFSHGGLAYFAEGGSVGGAAASVLSGGATAAPAGAIVGAIGDLNANIGNIASSTSGLSSNVGNFAEVTKDYSISSGKIIGSGFNSVSDSIVNMAQLMNSGFAAVGLAMAPKPAKFDWIGLALSVASIGVSAYGNFLAPSGGGGIQNGGVRAPASGGIQYGSKATGGWINGPGSGTSDSIPTMLSNGEFVINAAAAKKNKNLLEAINSGRMAHFAVGGQVGDIAALNTPPVSNKQSSQQVFNINVTGDVSRQTRREIAQMMPDIASGVNMHNKERGSR